MGKERKPIGYWTKERVFEEARKYRTRSELMKGCHSAYIKSLKNGWLDEMDWLEGVDRKHRGYWTKELVFEAARSYNTKRDFEYKCSGAYDVARKNKWLDEMNWFENPKAPNMYWTKERVFEVSHNYKTRTEFKKGCGSAYNVARKNKWLDEMEWLVSPHRQHGYWTKEHVFEVSMKYVTRGEFAVNDKTAYGIAWRNDWLDDMTWLSKIDERGKDNVYAYFWPELNTFYVGLTMRLKERHEEHTKHLVKDTAVSKFASEHGVEVPEMVVLETNLTSLEAQEKEDYYKQKFISEGWITINKGKTGKNCGSLGNRGHKWTKYTCRQEALKYTTRMDFKQGCSGAYKVAVENKWIDEYDWFIELKKPKGYWTYERVLAVSEECSNRSNFRKRYGRAYNIAKKYGWLDILFPKAA